MVSIESRIFSLPVPARSYPFALVRSGGRGFKNLSNRQSASAANDAAKPTQKVGDAAAHVQADSPEEAKGRRGRPSAAS